MEKIVLANGMIGKENLILLHFPYNLQLKELVKNYPGARWNVKLNVWMVSYTESQLDNLLRYFKGKVWLDYSGLRKVKIEAESNLLPTLSPELSKEINKFTDWMRTRRYSESTIKNYSGGLGLFFRFNANKNPELISNEDLETFHKDYIIRRKYSAPFQSLIINAVKLYFSNRLSRKLEPKGIERPKNPRLFPHVLNKKEVKAVLQAHHNVKHRAMLSLIYA